MEKELFNKVKLTEREWNILNTNVEYSTARNKCASILCYIKKHIYINGGEWSKSIDNIFKMYNRSHNYYISTGQLKNIVNKLKELGLICIEKIKKRNVYKLPMANKMAEKLADKKHNETLENTEVKEDFKKHREINLNKNNNILNTNKNNPADLIKLLKKAYKGVKPSLVATKKQLMDIVQSVLVVKGLHGNNPFSKAIQFLVFKKIKHSKQEINLLGAVSYIEKIIEDRIDAYKNRIVDVPAYVTGEKENIIRFNNFKNQREYDYDKLEDALLGYSDLNLKECF